MQQLLSRELVTWEKQVRCRKRLQSSLASTEITRDKQGYTKCGPSNRAVKAANVKAPFEEHSSIGAEEREVLARARAALSFMRLYMIESLGTTGEELPHATSCKSGRAELSAEKEAEVLQHILMSHT